MMKHTRGRPEAMRRWSTFAAAIAFLASCIGETAAQTGDSDAKAQGLLQNIHSVRPAVLGDECSGESSLPSGGQPLLFIVDKVGAPIFATAEAAAPRGGETLGLGELLFASDVRADCARVRVLKLSADSVASQVGWMRTEDLLVEQRSAVSIGQAIHQGVAVERSKVDGGFNEGNGLKLRYVTKPELRVRLGTRPGDDSGERLATFRWFYVYDLETHDDEDWGLMGEVADLFKGGGMESTDATAGERLLLGWAPLSNLQIWATNLALEINTHPDAVALRHKRGHGARVWAMRHWDARLKYDEPLDYLWPAGQTNPQTRAEVDFDPYGIAPDFPRLSVVQAYSRFIAVASAGSKDDELSPSRIGRIKRKVANVARDLRKMDVVFVLDATKSMASAIKNTRDFLSRISKQMREAASSVGTASVDLGAAGKIEILTNLDISVSLIGFQHVPPAGSAYTTREYFSGLDIVCDFASISDAFHRVTKELDGSKEALHNGVQQALQEKYGREGALSRLVIVITDEPGDTTLQEQIYRQLPTYSPDLELPSALHSLPVDTQKKERTKIFSIFLGSQREVAAFRLNSDIYSREVFEIVDYDHDRTQDFLGALGEALYEQQESILGNTQAFALVVNRREGAVGELGAFPGLTQLAVHEAMARQGLTFDEIEKLNQVVFFEGYVDVDSVGGLAGSESLDGSDALAGSRAGDSHTKDWRTRVYLDRRVVVSLHKATADVARTLQHMLEEDPLFGDFDSQDEATRRELVGMLMCLVRDAVTGTNQLSTGIEGREELLTRARYILELVDVDPEVQAATFARLLRIEKSLPLRTDGLMSMPIGDLFGKTKEWFLVQAQEYTWKSHGLDRIIRNKTVPEDFRSVVTATLADKRWFAPVGLHAVEEYGYIPPGYLP